MAEDEFKLSAEVPEPTNEPLKLKKKSRSPNYPAVGLEKALERARTLYAHARHHFMPVTTAHSLWNYKKGAGDQMVAALKYFGLLEVQGEKEGRQVRLAEAARRILGNAPDRAELLKVAALKPDLHSEIWERYEGDLPEDSVIRNYLVWERNFNEAFVDSFIGQFRGTLAYAQLGLSDKIRSDDDSEGEGEDEEVTPLDVNKTDTPRGKQPPPPSKPLSYREFPLYLTNHQRGILYVPAEMSYKDYELLQKQVENHLAVILVTSVVEDPPKEPTQE